VTTMSTMFHFNPEFNQDLCAWDLSQTTDTQWMFDRAAKFNQNLCSWGGVFQYESSNAKIFLDTACSTTAQPSEGSKGPFCAQCSDTSTCITTPVTASPTTASPTTASPTTASPTTASPTTASPTTSSPTTASPTTDSPTTNSPTTSPTESPPWKIDFKSLSMDFNASTIDEGLILTYEIGKGKIHVSSLYVGPCIDDVRLIPVIKPTGVIAKKEDLIMDSANPLMSTLELGYDVNKSLIATSNIWNDTTSQMKFCQVLQLVQNSSQMEDDLVIIEDIRDVTIGINSFLNFSLGVDLVGATVNAVNQTTSLADFFSAYICSGDDAMEEVGEDFELEPNEDLYVCFMSKSIDVEISKVTSMVIEGTDASGSITELSVVADGEASIKSITSLRYRNATSAICTTRVPINMFDYELADAKITIKGSVAMNLQGNAEERKLLIEDQVSTKNRDLQQLDNAMDEEAQFGISVNLKRSVIVEEEQILFLNSASKILVSIGPLVVVAYAIW